jgi:hypothetical protein
MSAAPRPTPRAPPGGPGSPFSAGCPILPAPRRASRSFVLAAARLRALHLDPLLDRRPHRHAARRTKNDQTNPLSPAPVFIERLWLRLAKILLVITIAALALRRR